MARLTALDATPLSLTIADYIDWQALRGSSRRHRTDLKRELLRFAATLDSDLPIDQVTRENCTAYLRSFQERECKANTVKAYHRILDAFFRWCVEEERIDASPMRRVPKPKLVQEQIKPLSAEDLVALLAEPNRKTFVGLRDVALISLMADTGLRISEVLNIRLGDVDTRARAITVVGKGDKPRAVFYGESVAGHLRNYLRRRARRGAEDLLFVSSLGEKLLRFAIVERMRDYGYAAGIRGKRVSPHTLRHTFAVNWLKNGGDTLSLQRLLGHSSPAMTTRYVNFCTADLAAMHRTVSPLDRLQAQNGAGPVRAAAAEKRTRFR
jgi:site-specific recombinase XerD